MHAFPVRSPWLVLAVAAIVTAGAAWAATLIEPEVDFVDTVPDHPGLEPYRELITRLDGVRFVAVYQAHDTAFGPHLRTERGFDALVEEQGAFAAELYDAFPAGTFSHQLSAHEAMKAGNYMLEKIATAGNARAESYSVPDDPVRYQTVRDQTLSGDSVDDVLAADGSSALMLFFFATDDSIEARHLTGEVADFIADWRADRAQHPATKDHQPSGLLWASYATDTINREEMVRLAPWAAVGVGLSLLWVVRRPANVGIAIVSLGAALVWTYGVMGAAGIRISFLSFLLAPIVVGIGIDYAVHVLHRYEEERDHGRKRKAALETAVLASGEAVALSATTTMAGLGMLLLVPNPLFAEIGGVAALGIGLGFVSAVTLVPALRAVLPDGKRKARRDLLGPRLALLAARFRNVRWAPVGVAALLTAGAGLIAINGTSIESGSAENEFPQDDPIILLQKRIEAEYGAFQRAYLVIEGDITEPQTLLAMHQALGVLPELPLYRNASAITTLLLADDATDEGAVDIVGGILSGSTNTAPDDEERLPQTQEEAKAAIDALFADPLWRTIAPFTISSEYDLAVVAITIDPWQTQDDLQQLVLALQGLAEDVQGMVAPNTTVSAAGAPVNRAELVKQTPENVLIATIGAAIAVCTVLAIGWNKRRGEGFGMALIGGVIVLAAAAWLLAAVVALDGWYDLIGSPNRAVLSDMFLIAFAVTVAVGVDDLVHLAERYWAERDAGASPKTSRRRAFRTAGRAITGTTLTSFVAFAIMADTYFLQSKNLAILAAGGILFAYVLTLLVVPAALGRKRPMR